MFNQESMLQKDNDRNSRTTFSCYVFDHVSLRVSGEHGDIEQRLVSKSLW